MSLYDRFRDGETGILVDWSTTSSHDFLNPHWNAMARQPPPVLWVAAGGQPPSRVPVPGDPAGDYFWTSDGGALSVTFVARGMQASDLGGERTSVGIFEPGSGRFRVLARAIAPGAERPGISFAGGEWIPGERKILVRRTTEADPWLSVTATSRYGREIASATSDEAIEDIVTGIEHLVRAGVADPARLGISGHSHGAWLGPLVMARAKMFRAGSFAEGVANSV